MKLSCSLLLLLLNILPFVAFAGEKDVYEFSWLDPDKEVYVLQNRKYRKAGMFHANLGYGMTTSGAFVDSNAAQGRFGYFMSEDWGFEGLYSSNSGKENETARSVKATAGSTTGQTPFRRIVQNYYGAMILWSPFYTKINTFNKIAYMDWIFGLGYGQLTEKNNQKRFNVGSLDDDIETSEKHSGVIWTAAMKFYVTEAFSIRGDFTGVSYSATEPKLNKKSWVNHYDATLSLGLAF